MTKIIQLVKPSLKITFFTALALSTTACPVQTDCITDTSPTNGRNYSCNGLDFTVSVPQSCSDGGCGLIVDVHGLSMSAKSENDGTNMRALGREAESRGALTPYIVVQPNAGGILPSWSASDDDDVASFVDQALDAWQVDQRRVHFGGFSQGGAMTYRFLCNYSDRIASFAPIAPAGQPNCALPKNPVLHTHGYSDTLVSYSGAEAARDAYIAAMGPDYQAMIVDQASRHTHTRYSGSGYLFELLEHDSSGGLSGGHCFPGGSGTFGCSGTFTVGEKILDFYIENTN